MTPKAKAAVLVVAMITTIVTLDVLFLRDEFALRLVTNVVIAAVFLGLAWFVVEKK